MYFQVERKSYKQQGTQKTTSTQAFLTEIKIGGLMLPRLKRAGPNSGGLVGTLKTRKGNEGMNSTTADT